MTQPLIPFRGKSHRVSLDFYKRVKSGGGSAEDQVRFNRLYGPDSFCLGWKSHRHNFPPIYEMYHLHSSANRQLFEANRLNTLKGHVHFCIHSFMSLDMAFKFYNLADILYCPDDERVEPHDTVVTGAFRAEFIWPLFKSSEAFWLTFQDLYHEVGGSIYSWPLDEPDVRCWRSLRLTVMIVG